jgi:hypothetical protein
MRTPEMLALEWEDIDFENLSMRGVRAVVHGRVRMVKTEYSEDELPLDPEFATVLLDCTCEAYRGLARLRNSVAAYSTLALGLKNIGKDFGEGGVGAQNR